MELNAISETTIDQLDQEDRMQKVYAEATSTLTELSKSRHKVSRLYFRLVQGVIIWFSIFTVSLFFSTSTIRPFREVEYEWKPIDLVSVAVLVISALQCINLGIAVSKVRDSYFRASRRFDALSESLYREKD